MIRLAFLFVAAPVLLAPGATCSQAYPSKPIRFIVPIAAGSGPDLTARMLAPDLAKQLGQQVIVDNRPGASSVIGMEMVARSAPDGYTIGYGPATILAVVPSLFGKMPYDTDKDLQMVIELGYTPNLLVTNLSFPVKSVRELIDYAKTNPGKLSYGSPGSGTSQHLSGELFKRMTGTQIVHVPYKGVAQVITDVIAAQVQLAFPNVAPVLPHVKAGRVRALAVTSAARSAVVPDLPTIAESGVPRYELTTWAGVVVPAGVPRAVVARLNAEFNKALVSPAFREKYL